jgi:mono/diheme cytochrome c family protein
MDFWMYLQHTFPEGFPLVRLLSKKTFAFMFVLGEAKHSLTLIAILGVLVSLGLAACSASVQPPTATPVPTPTFDPLVQGREVFTRVCAQCHGENGEGYANELQSPALNHTEHAFEHPDQQIHDWIVIGKLGLGRQMPPLGEQLTDDEVHAVIAYLHTLWTPSQLEIQQDITSRWPATPEPGREP